ncbi:TMEM175 family protein [Deinococcus humi]|uniref:Putative membrane protein n=1 Tax=Deinococcus humi TaxID=662880 RepID=A0A7W8JYM2_9DEIO|nr:TMEM175 family protein [Deinococcus humi]MBB5365631.1 putative membrane protein [Deinococcus humi]GGO36859.1 hypothetical protein GCM10008949_41360 [Deinococcus humi]
MTTRVEAFSDAVFAIITIMVLELPHPQGQAWSSLLRVWPTFLAYVLSFVLVGLAWTNHHHLLRSVRQTSNRLL